MKGILKPRTLEATVERCLTEGSLVLWFQEAGRKKRETQHTRNAVELQNVKSSTEREGHFRMPLWSGASGRNHPCARISREQSRQAKSLLATEFLLFVTCKSRCKEMFRKLFLCMCFKVKQADLPKLIWFSQNIYYQLLKS